MPDGTGASEPSATATIRLAIGGERFEARMTVPAGNTSPARLLPVFRALAESIVGVGVERAAAAGETVSCSKGCGACCRQLVPISATESRQIRTLVGELPEPRRSEVRERFARARRRLSDAGLLDRLSSSLPFASGTVEDFGLAYFRLGIPCPFLEKEACSIYEARPIACREYLVTSDPRHCASPSKGTVRCVPVPARVSSALCHLGRDPADRRQPWIPLILAPEWAQAHPEEPTDRPGPDLLRELVERLAGKSKGVFPES